jgi:hypothetical protein
MKGAEGRVHLRAVFARPVERRVGRDTSQKKVGRMRRGRYPPFCGPHHGRQFLRQATLLQQNIRRMTLRPSALRLIRD